MEPALHAEKARHLGDAAADGGRIVPEALQPKGQLVPDLVGDDLVFRALLHKADALRLLARRNVGEQAAGEKDRARTNAVGRKRGLELAKERAFTAAGKPAERDKLARAERQAHVPQGGRELPGVGKGQVFDAIELHVRASFLCSSTGVRQSRKYASSTLAEYGVSTPRAVG